MQAGTTVVDTIVRGGEAPAFIGRDLRLIFTALRGE
jgi:hypothetical protein